MRALILGKFVNFGGTQYLSYQVKKVLDQMGYETDVICGREHRFLPDDVRKVVETGYPYVDEERRIGILRNLVRLRSELKRIDTSHYDFTFNNHPNNFLFNADLNYLHGPSFVESMITEDGTFHKNLIYYTAKLLRLYSVYDGGNFLTHGQYTANLAKKYLPMVGVRPKTINYVFTPVDTDINIDFSSKVERTVLVFGRIARAKKVDRVMQLAERVNCKFIIAGFVAEDEKDYLRTLTERKPDNVEIISNPSEEVKRRLFFGSWTYLHTQPREHFGVTVAEAISNGCVPVVPKSGGPWEDIVEFGRYGLGYDSQEEAVQRIEESLQLPLSERRSFYDSRSRFSKSKFSGDLSRIIAQINENKR